MSPVARWVWEAKGSRMAAKIEKRKQPSACWRATLGRLAASHKGAGVAHNTHHATRLVTPRRCKLVSQPRNLGESMLRIRLGSRQPGTQRRSTYAVAVTGTAATQRDTFGREWETDADVLVTY